MDIDQWCDKWEAMMLRRWAPSQDPEKDTHWVCFVHGGEFDTEHSPCMKCWEEAGSWR